MKNFIVGLLVSYLLIVSFCFFSDKTCEHLLGKPIKALQYIAYVLQDSHVLVWSSASTEHTKSGVTIYDPEKSWGDYTMFVTASKDKVPIIDMQGRARHEWHVPFSESSKEENDLSMPSRVFSDRFDRRNIYVMHVRSNEFLFELGLIKFDGRSNRIWEYKDTVNHDLAQLDDRQLLTLVLTYEEDRSPSAYNLSPPFIEEHLVFLRPDGKEYRRISLLDAFAKSKYKSFLDDRDELKLRSELREGELLHPNTITLVPPEISKLLPSVSSNSVMLSFRHFSMLAILDLDTEKITWAAFGPWRGQHDPKFLKNGNILMFDNLGHLGEGGSSRIIEVDLRDLSIVWEYTGSPDKPFKSIFEGMIQVLPNGNILVTESHGGRIFELTRQKEIVWEYYVEDRVEHRTGTRIPAVYSAYRFSREELKSLGIE